ncbi:methyltransferase domain-containing protein [Acidovorax sp. sif1233]|uniref:class I SAM-dependent methyltransferase n=1 Tax=unclassified Acidovorax TaxID=2684926 RepID=UPI001C489811|nr:class I SAM-dependent methyltransferase [Acidovorax sp. sif1233]MBV7454048.1 methyltransferase domain-containing protein [Acidovorax sp. sif1233]
MVVENTKKDAVHAAAQRGYANEAQTYARGRPDYPAALSAWLGQTLGLGPGRQVADVGAGTGKFTALLAATGAGVVGVEPVDAMRARIDALQLPTVRAVAGTAQAIPLPSGALDALVCAQAFHWFATNESLDEFHRVLRPGGRLGLVWNVRDESVDWVAELTDIITPFEGDAPRFYKGDWRRPFPHPGFSPLAETRLPHEHVGPPQQVIMDRFMSVSFIAALPDSERAQVRARIEALIAHHPALRGQGTVRFPYTTLAYHCERV